MNIRDHTKQQVIDLSNHLAEIAARVEQPPLVDWNRIRKDIERYSIFLKTFTIPELADPEPGYKSGNGTTVATYTPRPDIEMKVEESSTGTPFLPSSR